MHASLMYRSSLQWFTGILTALIMGLGVCSCHTQKKLSPANNNAVEQDTSAPDTTATRPVRDPGTIRLMYGVPPVIQDR